MLWLKNMVMMKLAAYNWEEEGPKYAISNNKFI